MALRLIYAARPDVSGRVPAKTVYRTIITRENRIHILKKTVAVLIVALASTAVSSNVMPQGGDPDKGADLYAQKCARCHGSAGQGGIGPSLRGCSICDSFEALSEWIEEEMPPDSPQDCIDACAYETAAFIFVNLNGQDNGGGCFINAIHP
jgi:cytochrome c